MSIAKEMEKRPNHCKNKTTISTPVSTIQLQINFISTLIVKQSYFVASIKEKKALFWFK